MDTWWIHDGYMMDQVLNQPQAPESLKNPQPGPMCKTNLASQTTADLEYNCRSDPFPLYSRVSIRGVSLSTSEPQPRRTWFFFFDRIHRLHLSLKLQKADSTVTSCNPDCTQPILKKLCRNCMKLQEPLKRLEALKNTTSAEVSDRNLPLPPRIPLDWSMFQSMYNWNQSWAQGKWKHSLWSNDNMSFETFICFRLIMWFRLQ